MDAKIRTTRKENPRERAHPLSALLFLYMFPIFRRNYKRKGLYEEDLFEPLNEHKSKLLGDTLEDIWKQQSKMRKKYTLHWSLFMIFGRDLMTYGIFQLINEISLVALMPLAVGGFVSHFESETPKVTENQAYMYGGLLIMAIIIDVLINHSTSMGLMHMSMKMGVACSTTIYRKALMLSQSALSKTTVGHIINLLSNDIGNFDYSFVLFHYIWIAPVQACVGTYLLYRIIGVSAFSGISFLLLFIPLQIYFGKKQSDFQLRTALKTDERVGLMNEILNGIQVIKMYTWEKPFALFVSLSRRSEIKIIRKSFFLHAATFSLEMIITGMSTFITIIVYISLGNDITAEVVYATMAIYDALRPTITIMFSEAVSSIAEVHISLCRIQQFLIKEDAHESGLQNLAVKVLNNEDVDESLEVSKISCEFPKIRFKNVSASWGSENTSKAVVECIDMDINQNQLVAVVGPVGSGKSSLFNVILKELPISSGTLEIQGKIAYASQEGWLFSASVRQNILFGDAYDEDRYNNVLKICGLEPDLIMFPYGDRTVVGEKGKVLSGGQKARINLARCIYKRAEIYLLDDPLSSVDAVVGKQLYEECIKKFLHDKICVFITHQLQYLKSAHKIIILDEGKIVGQGTYDELQTSGLNFAKLLRQYQAEDEQTHDDQADKSNGHLAVPEDDTIEPEVLKEEMATGSIKPSIYLSYIRAGGNNFAIFILIFSFLLSQSVINLNDYLISYWVNLEQQNLTVLEGEINRDIIISAYAGVTAVTVVLALIQSIFFFMFFMRASVNIHDAIFSKISHATMKFFNLNPTGRILNRFSEDMGVIDEYIPGILADVIEIALHLIGAIIITSIINPWLLIPASGLLLFFWLLRSIYLNTSRSVKRLESVTRSPIVSHMTATLQGISTIRAFSAQTILKQEYDNYQDTHSSAWFLFIASSKAFTFWLDVTCGVFVSLVIISLIVFNRNYYGGDVGLVLTQYLGLTGVLQWGMHQWSELENNMTSVERVLEYKRVETEQVRKEISLPRNWPEYGKIVFRNVFMRYNLADTPVLKGLNFTIYPCEKVGVVGRTGAGKSSTIAALFQLYDVEGSITIDDVDCTQIPLEELRSKISIIPQEPVLFSGTLRKNLDPFEEYDDEVLWNALEQVELKYMVSETIFGLSSSVAESGSNFSVGQRQLVCLARAIIRNNKILVMDEATANVDPQTDSLIQKTIRKKFADCTVLTIAHRLHTIMDSDKVLVIDAGKVIEFDEPHNLLSDPKSCFYNMVQTVGKGAAKNLHLIAEEEVSKINKSAKQRSYYAKILRFIATSTRR